MRIEKRFRAMVWARRWLRTSRIKRAFIMGTVEPTPWLNLSMQESVARLVGKAYKKGRQDERRLWR